MAERVVLHNRFAERLQPRGVALVLVDCQQDLIDRLARDPEAISNNLLGLARLARAVGVPVVLGACGGPVLPELVAMLAPARPIRRMGGGFWEHAQSAAAVRACGRGDVLLAGLAAEGGIVDLALAAREQGYDVHAVIDSSAGGDEADRRVGSARLGAAGVNLTSWVAVMAQFASAGVGIDAHEEAALNLNLARYKAGPAAWEDVFEIGEQRGSGARALSETI